MPDKHKLSVENTGTSYRRSETTKGITAPPGSDVNRKIEWKIYNN